MRAAALFYRLWIMLLMPMSCTAILLAKVATTRSNKVAVEEVEKEVPSAPTAEPPLWLGLSFVVAVASLSAVVAQSLNWGVNEVD